jgi:hypothetical protein
LQEAGCELAPLTLVSEPARGAVALVLEQIAGLAARARLPAR